VLEAVAQNADERLANALHRVRYPWLLIALTSGRSVRLLDGDLSLGRSMPNSRALALAMADLAARAALSAPLLERALVAACHRPMLRNGLRLGAIAVGYTRVLRRPELRVAELGKYQLRVNVSEELGTTPFFFGDSGTLWLTALLLRPGDNCVDAGANMGHYTFLMASEVGPSGRVLAFEANPALVEILASTIALNHYESRINLHALALWEESNQEKSFYLSVNSANSGTSSLIDHRVYLRADHQITVKTITLDDAAAQAGVDHFRLVKIDVERAEEFVIAGARNLLSSHKIDFLIVELVAGTTTQRLLLAHGYVGWLADPHRRALIPIDRVPDGTFGDFVFASPDRTSELSLG
jgi:FkbM family methyltransferase